MKLLDCTLRDGGYYTNWDFDQKIVSDYIKAMNDLPVDYIELGYRNKPKSEYLGQFGYCPTSVLRNIRSKSNKKLAIMLNEKDYLPSDLDVLLKPIIGLVDMVRVAIDPKNFDRAVVLAKAIKEYGFSVGFNVMYMSTWLANRDFLSELNEINDCVDIFCMVDSFGGINPSELVEITKIVRKSTSVTLGFHGHDNLQFGLINALTAKECGVEVLDATILGMGRGAGNLKMELLLTYLNKQGLSVDFNVLGDIITTFSSLLEKYKWGTQLPYMISGANSIPQKEVMELVTNRLYPFNSIVRSLQNRKNNMADNAKYPVLKNERYKKVLIIGGGPSVKEHVDAISAYIDKQESIALVFSSARYASLFQKKTVPQYYCLLGPESARLRRSVDGVSFHGVCVLPPYPRKMGTDVPPFAVDCTYELGSVRFTTKCMDSCTTIAIQTALDISNGDSVFIVGYDGYAGNVLSEKEIALSDENRTLFDEYEKVTGAKLLSLTPTLYKNLKVVSVYQFI